MLTIDTPPTQTAPMRDPAERNPTMRIFYRNWRPTRFGKWLNRIQGWWCAAGLPPDFVTVLEVRGRRSGLTRVNPIVITTVDGNEYLVSMLGTASDWVRNVEAARGDATLRHGHRRRRIHLTGIPPDDRAPILREYVRIASSGGQHVPLTASAPLSEFQAIAAQYPVYRIDPPCLA